MYNTRRSIRAAGGTVVIHFQFQLWKPQSGHKVVWSGGFLLSVLLCYMVPDAVIFFSFLANWLLVKRQLKHTTFVSCFIVSYNQKCKVRYF